MRVVVERWFWFGKVFRRLGVAIGFGCNCTKVGPSNKANAADCPSKVFVVWGVARHGDSSFDNVCWQTTDSRRDVLCRVESFGDGFSSSALIGGR